MKDNIFHVVSLAAVLAYAPSVAFADTVDFSLARIVRAKAENPQQKVAADELALHLRLVCGRAGEGADTGISFVFAKPPGAKSVPYAAYAKREGNVVWIWGDDKGDRRLPFYGSAFAVYGFLENVFGVRWVAPGEDGIVFVPRAHADLPSDWSYEFRFPAEIASVRRTDPEWGRRLRFAPRKPFRYGHAFLDWQDRYAKSHPQYLGMAPDGQRGVRTGWRQFAKLCLSNPEVPSVIVSNWVASSKSRYLNICPNDGSVGYCVCPGCLALDADRKGEPFLFHKTDRYFNFWNRVVERAREVRPDVMAVTYLYSYYRFSPRREKIARPDNMLFGIVPRMGDDYEADFAGFRKAGVKRFFFRPNYLCYRGRLPRGLERYLYDTFHFYHREGAIGYDYDGAPAQSTALERYVVLRQVAFPGLSFDAIMDEWCSQFGDAAKAAKAYYARIRDRGDRARAKIAARMKRDQVDVLDDSELAGTVVEYHSLEALKGDLAVLEGADLSVLSPVERRRFDVLVAEVRNHVAIFPEEVEKTKESVRRNRSWEKECREFGPNRNFRGSLSVKIDASPERAASPLSVAMPRIGTLRPRSAGEIADSNWTLGCETLDRDFADFAEYRRFVAPLGIKTIRLQGGWAKCEKVRGHYDFAWLDNVIDYARSKGLNVLLETDYGNPIYPGGGGWDIAGGFPTSEEALAAWDAWVEGMATHFKGRVRDWAMWNEPDIGSTYGEIRPRTPAEIAAFNVRTARIIKRIIPDSRLAGLSLAHAVPAKFEECLKLMGEDVRLFDWMIYHGYATAPEQSYAVVDELKKILKRYSPNARLRQGENGCPSEMGTFFALKFIPWSEWSQAKWDMRRMLGDLGHDVESSVFTICDFNHKSREVNLKGLLRANENREVIAVKKAYYAVQNVASVFDDSLVRVANGNEGTKDGTISFWSYRKPDGRPVYAFWTHADSMAKPQGSRQHVGVGAQVPVYVRPGDSFETRPAVFHVTTAMRDPVWVDMLSGWVYAFPKCRQVVHSAGVTLVDVPVYDSPCLLAERSALAIQEAK